MINIQNVGTEANLAANYAKIDQFYKTGLKLHKIQVNDRIILSALELPYKDEFNCIENSTNTLVIIAGRAETEHKYAELLYSLKDMQMRVIVCFVRGQGQSSRIIYGSSKCHIEDFSYYVNDIDDILTFLDIGSNYKLMAFSLGGLIALHSYFKGKFPHKPGALALIAPFLGVNYPISSCLLYHLIAPLCNIRAFALAYTPQGKEYKRIPFEDNIHSHSIIRYENYHDYYAQNPALPLAGPTFNFVKECLKAQHELGSSAYKFNIPVICLCAGDDHVVSTPAAKAYFQQHKSDPIAPVFQVVPHAYHDILNEEDTYRNPALKRVLDFLYNGRILLN